MGTPTYCPNFLLQIFDSGFLVDNLPAVLGWDAAGEVTKVAPDVKDYQIGDRVSFEGTGGDTSKGTFQQYAVVDARHSYKVKSRLLFETRPGADIC